VIELLTSEMTVTTEHILRPILITLAIAIPLAVIGIVSGISIEGAPLPEEEGGLFFALLNALFFTLFAVIGVTLIYFAVKYGKERILRIFFIICFGFMGVFLIFFYFYLILAIFNLVAIIYSIIIIALSIGLGLFLSYALLSEKTSASAKNTALLLFGALIGSFLGIILPTWTAFLLVGILSIYDIIAVFKGPIKKIIEMTEADDDHNLPVDMTYADRNFEIGLGDLAFYSMLSTHTLFLGFRLDFLIDFGLIGAIIPCVCTTAGIILGAYLTFQLLKKREMLPGLPISVGLGILFYLISLLVFWLL
jgi:presenilin-like A22 family membrane protease